MKFLQLIVAVVIVFGCSTISNKWNESDTVIDERKTDIEKSVLVELYGEVLEGIVQETGLIYHAILRVKTGVNDLTIEMYGPSDSKKGRPQINPFDSDSLRRKGRVVAIKGAIMPPKNSRHFAEKLIQFGEYFKNHPEVLPDYNYCGPNSNGYIRALVELAGGKINMPTSTGAVPSGFVGNERIAEYEQVLEKRFGPLENAKEDRIRANEAPLIPQIYIVPGRK
jgi:hypothetical protein